MITKTTYAKRRLELMRRMGEGVAIIPTAQEHDRTPGIPYPFRPDSNFFYHSGFTEANATIVLFDGKSILFCQEKNDETKLWTGELLGTKDAVTELGFDEAYPIEDFEKKMLEFLLEQRTIFVPYANKALMAQTFDWIEKIDTGPRPHYTSFKPDVRDVCKLIAEMRLIKDTEEIELMRHVAIISAQAHIEVMRACYSKMGLEEWYLETIFQTHTRNRGCSPIPAYPTIVGAAEDACVLHWTQNNGILFPGSLILFDAGAEFDGYAADITRTFPVSGRFSAPQALLYQLVLDAQLAATEEIRPGNTYHDVHVAAVRILTEGLVELGLLKGNVEELVQEGLNVKGYGISYKKFFPHRTSHWIGLDVHDVGDYQVNYSVGDKWRILEAGMVLTVEPGLYIPADCMDVEKKWRGIGIRIEDDILVTKDGHEVLSAAAPKTIEAIENLMRGK